MMQKTGPYLVISIIFLLLLILLPGAGGMSISYSSTTNTNGAYSSSIGGTSTSLGNSLSIQSSSVVSGSQGGTGGTTVGNESGSFNVDDPPSSDPDFGDIRVVSSPAGASVTMNTFVQPNLTPMMITMLNPGIYTLLIKKEGYEQFSTEITIVKGKVKTVIADFDGNYTPEGEPVQGTVPEETKSAGVWS